LRKVVLGVLIIVFVKVEAQTATLAIADSLYATGNYTKAINYYAKEGSEKAGLQIARAYNALGNHDKAIIQYESVVEKNQEFQIARFELGKLYLKTKRFEESSKLFSYLVGSDNGNPEYWYYQGESFRELDQPTSYLVAYKRAIDADSTHLKSIFQLGKHFVVNRERGNAIDYLNKGLNFYPNDVSLINLKALALFNNDEYEKALPLFERLLELGEKKEFVYMKLAYCYYQTWGFEKAIHTYKLLVQKDGENHDAYFNLGHVFFKDRQMDSANHYVKKSIEVQKVTFEKEYETLARFARTSDDLKTALKYYKKAFAESPSNYRNYYQICTLVDQTSKDRERVLNYYEDFIEKFGKNKPYVSEMVQRRISALKEELHFSKD
jgi:tetratricopeptide (TPR) repeat protein